MTGRARIAQVAALMLAVALAVDMHKTGGFGDPTAMSTVALGKAMESALTLGNGQGLVFQSEGDYPVLFVAAPNPGNKPLSGALIKELFRDSLEDGMFEDEDDVRKALAHEVSSAAETKAFLEEPQVSDLPNDPEMVEEAAVWGRVHKLLLENLTDTRLVILGPKDEDGSLAVDQGLYAKFIVGKTRDGQVAGVYYGSVET
jgi:hypothetical protein